MQRVHGPKHNHHHLTMAMITVFHASLLGGLYIFSVSYQHLSMAYKDSTAIVAALHQKWALRSGQPNLQLGKLYDVWKVKCRLGHDT